MNNDKEEKQIKLKDGRTLGYAEYGNPNGKPVFYFHGWPGSRTEVKPVDDELMKINVRIISIDRPGMGLSDSKPKRKFLDWPDDVLELADKLNIEKFSVLGVSGGGPYSLACACKITPNRLKSAAICGGMGLLEAGMEGMKKSNRVIFGIAKKSLLLLRFLIWFGMGRKIKDEESAYKLLLARKNDFPEEDQKLFEDPEFGKIFAKSNVDAFKQGSKWVAYEGKLYASPWDFKLEDIPSKIKVYIFQGEKDDQVPKGMAEYMEKAIPNCKATYFPNETHFGAAINRITEMTKVLTTNL